MPINDNLAKQLKKVELRLHRLFDEGCAAPATGIFSAPLFSEPADQVRSLTMRGGKRMRASLVICGADLFKNEGVQSAIIDAAAALELLHVYFLIHDDIMDEDETRRGGPAVHAALARRYNSVKQGRDLAILAGDLAASLHEGLIANLNVPKERRRSVAQIFAEMHAEVIHGQTLDLLGSRDAKEIVTRKTAAYTTVGPLAVGAALAGASLDEQLALAEIARPLGVAFQLKDDLLGLFGDPDTTGKPAGTDIKEGKRTFLIQEAMRLGNDAQKEVITATLGSESASDAQLSKAVDAVVESGARRSCEEEIRALKRDALHRLDSAVYKPAGKALLSVLALKMIDRDK